MKHVNFHLGKKIAYFCFFNFFRDKNHNKVRIYDQDASILCRKIILLNKHGTEMRHRVNQLLNLFSGNLGPFFFDNLHHLRQILEAPVPNSSVDLVPQVLNQIQVRALRRPSITSTFLSLSHFRLLLGVVVLLKNSSF